jgi:hypothetical protein
MKNFKVKDLMISVHPRVYSDNGFMDAQFAATRPVCMAVSCKATKPTKDHYADSTNAADLLNLKQVLAGMQANRI